MRSISIFIILLSLAFFAAASPITDQDKREPGGGAASQGGNADWKRSPSVLWCWDVSLAERWVLSLCLGPPRLLQDCGDLCKWRQEARRVLRGNFCFLLVLRP
ncbi:hypothetical protein BJY52DRAFT_1227174 [Lactarius psammicola]|nr:hypothetical protein BJY52DRAFT_1227174 [Lactarius psammicola]